MLQGSMSKDFQFTGQASGCYSNAEAVWHLSATHIALYLFLFAAIR